MALATVGETPTVGWVRDLATAAEEAGYGIVSIGPSRIELMRAGVTIVVESIFLSGEMLRRTLKEKPDV